MQNTKTSQNQEQMTTEQKVELLIQKVLELEEAIVNHRHYRDGTPGRPL